MSQTITLNSLKLIGSIKTPRGRQILQRAEKQLADECIRAINNTIDTCTCIRDTFMNELKVRLTIIILKNALNL